MKRRIFVSLSLCLSVLAGGLLASCASSKHVGVDFSKTKELKLAEQIELDSAYFSYPKVALSKNYLCVNNSSKDNTYFTLYSYPDLKFIRRFGTKGNGPGEMPMLLSFDIKDETLMAYCSANNTIHLYDLNSKDNCSYSTIYLRGNGFCDMCFGPGDTFLGTAALPDDERVLQIDRAGNVIGKFLSLTCNPEDVLGHDISNSWQSMIQYSQQDNVAVVATICGDIVNIVDFSTNPPTETNLEGEWGEPVMIKLSGEYTATYMQKYYTYRNIWIGDKIYTLFSGRDYERRKEGTLENSIRVMSKKGVPIVKYTFDKQLTPSSFFVNEKTGVIYLFLPDEDKPVWMFKM